MTWAVYSWDLGLRYARPRAPRRLLFQHPLHA